MRALAVASVMIHHVPAGRRLLPGGFIGVDVFFVLSGALITTLLMAEHETTGTVALGRFYWRRGRRLYPGLLAMLTVVVIVGMLTLPPAMVGTLPLDALLAALYLSALVVPFRAAPLVAHTWSLSIEEAFYLFWPAFMRFAARGRPRAMLLFLLLLLIATPAWRIHLWFEDVVPSDRIYFALDTRPDAIAFGCVVGILVRRGVTQAAKRTVAWLTAPATLGLILMAHFGDRTASWYTVFGYSLAAALAAIVVAHLFLSGSRWLGRRPLVWVGKRSYSLYLWHVPLFLLGAHFGLSFFVLVPCALLLAEASFRWVESPLRAA